MVAVDLGTVPGADPNVGLTATAQLAQAFERVFQTKTAFDCSRWIMVVQAKFESEHFDPVAPLETTMKPLHLASEIPSAVGVTS